MTNETKNVPELRFPEFDGEWEEKKIGELSQKTISGGTPRTSKLEFWNGDIPWIQSSDLSMNKLYIDSSNKSITEEAIDNSSAKIIPAKSIAIVTRVGVGKLAFVDFKYSTSQDFISLANLTFDTNFSIYSLYNKIKIISKNLQGTSIKGITKNELLNTVLLMPLDIVEQHKIGEFFSKLDRQIELEEQKLAKLEEQKKGYMQKLFSQELRFKDQDGNDYPKWEKKFIKDIFIFENNRRKPITSSLREKGLYPYYGATGIIDYVKDYLFNNEERLLIGEDGAKWGQFENSSFIANGQYWVNNHAHVVKSNNHNLYFMNYYLNFKELRTFVTGNAPAKLTHANLCNINLEIPCLNEQDKISALLKSIDKKMNNQINKIVLLKRRKQGLLQKMFV